MGMGGSKAPKETTQRTISEPPAYLAPHVGEAAGAATNLYRGYEKPIWQGPDVVPFTSDEQAVRQLLSQTASGPLSQLAGQGMQATQFGLGPVLSPESNPYLRQMGQAMIDPMLQNTMEALRGIQSQALAQGAYGGSREGLLGAQTIGNLQRNMGNALTSLYGNAYGQGLNFMQGTMGMLPQMANLQLAPGQVLAGLADQDRMIREAQLAGARERFEESANAPIQRLNTYVSQLGGVPGMGGTSQSVATQPAYRRSPLVGALGGGLAGAPFGPIGMGAGALLGALL